MTENIHNRFLLPFGKRVIKEFTNKLLKYRIWTLKKRKKEKSK